MGNVLIPAGAAPARAVQSLDPCSVQLHLCLGAKRRTERRAAFCAAAAGAMNVVLTQLDPLHCVR